MLNFPVSCDTSDGNRIGVAYQRVHNHTALPLIPVTQVVGRDAHPVAIIVNAPEIRLHVLSNCAARVYVYDSDIVYVVDEAAVYGIPELPNCIGASGIYSPVVYQQWHSGYVTSTSRR